MTKKIFIYCLLLNMLSVNIAAQTFNFLPTIPEPATNPHLASAFNGVKIGDNTFYSSLTEADETLLAVMAYLHPSSPFRNQQAVLDRLLFLLDTELGGWESGAYPLNEMSFCFQANVAYLMLKQYKPEAISTTNKTKWESGIRKNIDAIFAGKPDMYDKLIVGAVWLNGDERLAMGAYFGALALNDATSAAKAKAVLETCMPQTLLPDGGTHYVGYQNESPSYHGEATIRPFVWYYIFTQSQIIKDFICATKSYIPLVTIPIGVGYKEWSTSPAWKPYYNQTTLKLEALAKAYLMGDPYNYEIGKGSQNLYLAFIYKSGLTGVTLPDNYMLFDKNCLGPRGRFGNWGVVGTLRDPSIPTPELTETRYLMMDGVNTLVGAFTLNANASSSTYPLNAAFQGAAPEVKYAQGKETDWSRGAKWAFLTGKDRKDAQTRSKSIYGLSSRYGVSKPRFTELTWLAEQQWVVTPDRVIGMTEIEATSDAKVYGLAQRIQLVSGRRNASGSRKKLIRLDNNTFEYGDLRLKIHTTNYSGMIDSTYHGVMNDTLDTNSVMIALHDSLSGKDAAINYTVGTRRYALFEVTNNARSYSTNVSKLTLTSGLEGFEFQESSERKIRMVHNTTGKSIALNTSTMVCPFVNTRLLKSWDETMLIPLAVSNGKSTIPYTSIPAYAHILVINSNIASDHSLGFDTYNEIFPLTATPLQSTQNNLSPKITDVDSNSIQIVNLPDNKQTYISIYNAKGELITTTKSETSTKSIKINNLNTGIYIAKIDLGKQSFSLKFSRK